MNLRQLVDRSDRVFPSHPNVARYFPAVATEGARRRLVRAIERGDGPCVVIGSAGVGKSLLLQVLAAGFKERFDVVLLSCTSLCSRRALLQAIHFELGLEYRRRDEGQLRLSLLDQLLAADQSVDGLLLLVDEAQALPQHLIEELRVLTNLVRGGSPRVRLVLAGLPSLEESLAAPELESFSQRLAVRSYLGNLTRNETTQYVRAHLAASSVDPDQTFAADAWPALYDATDGVPRLVNQLCDQTLLLAAERGASQVDRTLVQAAWAELQQLPMPCETTMGDANSKVGDSGVIEFGSLEMDDPPTPVTEPPTAIESPTPTVATLAPTRDAGVFTGAEAEVVEPTELDDEIALVEAEAAAKQGRGSRRTEVAKVEPLPIPHATASSPSPPQRRPRVFSGCVPEAVDPFTDEFDEEELVLESFGALSSMFHAHTPQVENRRNPAFSQLLGQAVQTTTARESESDPNELEINARPASRRDRETDRSSIRLAVVADSTAHDFAPFAEQSATESEEHDDVDELLTQFGDVIIARPTSLPFAADRGGDASAMEATSTSRNPSCAAETVSLDVGGYTGEIDAVLVIEEEAVGVDSAGSGVRREEYRNLFSRLRHG